jgi:hypothetical protein
MQQQFDSIHYEPIQSEVLTNPKIKSYFYRFSEIEFGKVYALEQCEMSLDFILPIHTIIFGDSIVDLIEILDDSSVCYRVHKKIYNSDDRSSKRLNSFVTVGLYSDTNLTPLIIDDNVRKLRAFKSRVNSDIVDPIFDVNFCISPDKIRYSIRHI